jgi:7-keto-8-aminopelargonate synthetase-like enzyme
VDGQAVTIACSNDYLGLSHHPKMSEGPLQAGAGSSRLITGTRPAHLELEQELQDWLGQPALLFSSGYLANLALFSTVCTQDDVIASDALNHASIIDGMRLSKARKVIVEHCAPDQIPPDATLIAVEGLFSMDGDTPALQDYPSKPWLAVDEAHSLGCIGPEGRGVAAACGVTPDIVIGTFGKAFGAAGAFVAGPQLLKDLLINAGRSFIYSTAPPESTIQKIRTGLAIIRTEGEERRERLQARTRQLRQGLGQIGLEPLGTHHIVPITFGEQTMTVARGLKEAGILATGIRFPTVPKGMERIRFTVCSEHTPDQIDHILGTLDKQVSR